MKLMPEKLRRRLPPLYANEEKGLAAKAIVHYFMPDGGWDWYASEGSPVDADGYYDTDKPKVDFLFFGWVRGPELELGYFSLAELEQFRGVLGLLVERDLYWKPVSLRELEERLQR